MQSKNTHHPDNDMFRLFCQQDRGTMEKIYTGFFPLITSMVKKNQGNTQDAEDVFQEGLLVLLGYCEKTGFTLNVALKSFFYAVCKNIWIKKLIKKGRLRVTFVDVWEYVDLEHIQEQIKEMEQKSEQLLLIWKSLARLSEVGRKTLLLFYIEDKSFKQIAEIMGFASENSAKVQKSKYLKQLRELVKGDPDFQAN